MPEISYTFLRNNHTKQGRISTWTREQPGTTRKEKMMGDYTEHLISMAGGDGDELDQIQRRLPKIPESAMSRTERDRAYLIALVREQAAQIGRVRELVKPTTPSGRITVILPEQVLTALDAKP